jgi:hypothetical protein
LTNRFIEEISHSRGNALRGDAAGLQDKDSFSGEGGLFKERERKDRCFARSGGSLKEGNRMFADPTTYGPEMFGDRKPLNTSDPAIRHEP